MPDHFVIYTGPELDQQLAKADHDNRTALDAVEGINTGDQDLENLTNVQSIIFDTTPTVQPHTPGQVFWDDTDKTLVVQMAHADVTLSLGQEQYIRGFNNTGVPIPNGKVVYVNGTQGQRPSIALADASTEATNYAIGVVTHLIGTTGDDRYGYITTIGIVRDIDTSLWTPGVPLWLSTDAGELTQTKPEAPNHAVYIGIPLNATNNGSIFVNPNIGNELNELHDVHYPTLPAGGDVLIWNGVTNRWENTVAPFETSGAVSTHESTYDHSNLDTELPLLIVKDQLESGEFVQFDDQPPTLSGGGEDTVFNDTEAVMLAKVVGGYKIVFPLNVLVIDQTKSIIENLALIDAELFNPQYLAQKNGNVLYDFNVNDISGVDIGKTASQDYALNIKSLETYFTYIAQYKYSLFGVEQRLTKLSAKTVPFYVEDVITYLASEAENAFFFEWLGVLGVVTKRKVYLDEILLYDGTSDLGSDITLVRQGGQYLNVLTADEWYSFDIQNPAGGFVKVSGSSTDATLTRLNDRCSLRFGPTSPVVETVGASWTFPFNIAAVESIFDGVNSFLIVVDAADTTQIYSHNVVDDPLITPPTLLTMKVKATPAVPYSPSNVVKIIPADYVDQNYLILLYGNGNYIIVEVIPGADSFVGDLSPTFVTPTYETFAIKFPYDLMFLSTTGVSIQTYKYSGAGVMPYAQSNTRQVAFNRPVKNQMFAPSLGRVYAVPSSNPYGRILESNNL